MIPRRDRHDSSDRIDSADRAEPTQNAEPIENREPIDPADPIERTDPAEPIESTEPFEPIDRIDPSDRIDQSESDGDGMAAVCTVATQAASAGSRLFNMAEFLANSRHRSLVIPSPDGGSISPAPPVRRSGHPGACPPGKGISSTLHPFAGPARPPGLPRLSVRGTGRQASRPLAR